MKSRLTKLCSLFLTFAVTATTVFSSNLTLVSAYADDEVAVVEEIAAEDEVVVEDEVAVEEAVAEEQVEATEEATEEAVVEEVATDDSEVVEELVGVSGDAIEEPVVEYVEFGVEVVSVSLNEAGDTVKTLKWPTIGTASSNKYFIACTGIEAGFEDDLFWVKQAYENNDFYTSRRGCDFSPEGLVTTDYLENRFVCVADGEKVYYGYVNIVDLPEETPVDIGAYDVEANSEGNDKGIIVTFADDDYKYAKAPGEFYYTGKALKPTLKIIDGRGNVLKAGKDYKLTYKNNKAVSAKDLTFKDGNQTVVTGTGSTAPYVKVDFKGDYNTVQSITKYFKIVPVDVCPVTLESGSCFDYDYDVALKLNGRATNNDGLFGKALKASAKATSPAQKVEVYTWNYAAKKAKYVKSTTLKAAKGANANDYTVKYVSANEYVYPDVDALWAKAEEKIPANATGYYYALVSGNGLNLAAEAVISAEYVIIDSKKDVSKAKVTMSVNSISCDALAETNFRLYEDEIKSIELGSGASKITISENDYEYIEVNDASRKPCKNAKLDICISPDNTKGLVPGLYKNIKSDLKITAGKDISKASFTVAGVAVPENGKVTVSYNAANQCLEDVVYEIVVKDGSNLLVEGNDFTLSKAKKIPWIGKTKVTVIGKNKYAGTKKVLNVELKVTDKNLLKDQIYVGVESLCYDDFDDDYYPDYSKVSSNKVKADEINSGVTVCYRKSMAGVVDYVALFDDINDLDPKKAYAVKYAKIKDNKCVATVTFKGNYKSLGKITVNIPVKPEADIDDVYATGECDPILLKSTRDIAAKDLAKKAKITVTDLSGKKLTNKEFAVSSNIVKVSTGETVSANATLSANTLYELTVNGNSENYTFKNQKVYVQYGKMLAARDVQKQVSDNYVIYQRYDTNYFDNVLPTITIDGKTLVRGKDYELSPKLPKKADYYSYLGTTGTKTIILTTKPNSSYTGSINVKIKVVMRKNIKNDTYKYVLSK